MDYTDNLSASDRHWFELIQECRTSGKSDRQWLQENNIKPPTFYYHVKQLRKKSCEILASTFLVTANVQEVVPLIIEDMPSTFESHPECLQKTTDQLIAETAIRLTVKGVTVEITNSASQTIISNTLAALRFLC